MNIHVVNRGETLYSIARRYGVSPNLLALNNGINRSLAVGETLVILYPKVVHTAVPGDSIYSIAAMHGTTVRNIYKNNIFLKGSPDIFAGQTIVIEYSDTPLRSAASNGYAYDFINSDTLNTALPYLTFVSPFTYGITENGNLVPLDETVVADENLIIQLALFRNGYYDYFSDKQEPHIRKSMSEWKIVADNFWFWAYDSDFHRYLFFYDSFRNIAKDVRGFKDYGITYLCVQGSHDSTHIWQNKIRAYAYRKLMWDSKLDDNRLIDEFIDLYYGEGANAVRTIVSLFHKQFEKLEEEGKTVFCGSFGSCEKPEVNPPELLYEAIKAVEKGEQKISSASLPEKIKAEFIRRLEEVRLTPLMLLCDNYYFYYPSAPREEYEAARKDFFDCAERANLDKVAERWTTDMYRAEPGTSERTDL